MPVAARSHAIRQQAEQLGSILPPLMVAADRVASTVIQGVHGRRRVGSGEAFWQFRRYQPGDPAGRIDWRQSARGQYVFVRENEWEAAQSVWLWRDPSASMLYNSGRQLPDKRARADLLLLATAALLIRGGERVALLDSAQPPGSTRATLSRLASELATADVADRGGEGRTTENLPAYRPLPRYARVVLFGDFLGPLADLRETVARLVGHGVRGHLQQVLDPAELTLPFNGRIRFEGMEDEGSLVVRRTEALRPLYLQAIEAQRAGLHEIAKSAGWSFAQHRTDQSPEAALLGIYTSLAEPERR